MGIFFKYITKSMLEKKGRFLLLIIAITLSTGLFVASLGVVDIAIDAIADPILETYENKDIIINSKDEGVFFNDNDLVEEGVKNLIKEIQIDGVVNDKDENIALTVNSREEQYIDKEYIIEGSLNDFSGEKCIISKRVSEDRDIKIGDKLPVIIAGKNINLEVAAIYGNKSNFYNDNSSSFSIIAPYEYISKSLGYENKYNLIIANKTEDKIEDSIKIFNKVNSKYEATVFFDEDDIKEQTGQFTQILYFMLLIVVFMSAIIIFSSFKLIITERLSVIGTFLSQGATKITIEKILYLESIFYGLIGGVVGILLGIGGLSLISKVISPLAEYGIYESFDVPYLYLIIGIIFAIVLSFASSLVPIKKIRKLQVKEVILNNVNVSMRIGYKKFFIGLVLIIASIIVAISDKEATNQISPIFIFVTFIGLVLAYPKVVDVMSNILYKLLRGKSKTIVLGINNLRTSKVLLGNTTLIIISMISIFMIGSIGTSMVELVTDGYENLNFDISISNISTIRQGDSTVADEILAKLNTIDGYKKDSENIIANGYGILNNDDSNFLYFMGVDPNKFKDYNEYLELDSNDNKNEYKELLNGKEGIVLTNTVAKNNDIEKGDTISLEFNNVNKELEVIGIIDGKMYNNGQFAILSSFTMENLFKYYGGDQITIKTTKDPEIVKKDLKVLAEEFGVTLSTKNDNIKENKENNQMVVDVLSIFSFMAIFIAALGVLNNITIGFLQRKRELAVFSSVGMQKKNRNIMLLFESIVTVIWATLVSIPGSVLVIKLLTKTLKTIDMPLNVTLDYSQLPIYIMASVGIVLIATIPVVFKSKRLSIINELKYE